MQLSYKIKVENGKIFKMSKTYKFTSWNLNDIRAIDKKSRIILLLIYAMIMFATIANEINTITFVILFVVAPISIYYFVKNIFPKEENDQK